MIDLEKLQMRSRRLHPILLLVCVLSMCSGCRKKHESTAKGRDNERDKGQDKGQHNEKDRGQDNGFQVVGWDWGNNTWMVTQKTFDPSLDRYHQKLFLLACVSYQDESGLRKEANSCVLDVGEVFVTDPNNYVLVDPHHKDRRSGKTRFYMDRGQGADRAVQTFRIIKEEVLPDEK